MDLAALLGKTSRLPELLGPPLEGFHSSLALLWKASIAPWPSSGRLPELTVGQVYMQLHISVFLHGKTPPHVPGQGISGPAKAFW